MKHIIILSLLILSFPELISQEIINASYETDSERIIKQELIVPASLNDVWNAWTTQEGLQSWFAPVIAIDFERGGKLKSRFDDGGKISDRNTVISEILDYIPNKRIVLKDNLVFLLTYGIAQKWIPDVAPDFLFELVADNSHLYTTIEFAEISEEETKLTIIVTGFKLGDNWKQQFDGTIAANEWTFKNLIQRFKTGPIDWSQGH